MNRRSATLWLFAVIVAAALAGAWLYTFKRVEKEIDLPPRGEARYNPLFALKLALQAHGLTPEAGPAIVTGASGGVGSVAVALLARAGWHVIASTGRDAEADYLRGLGAAEILDRAELSIPGKPLGKERWAAGVDAVGSTTLANLLAQTKSDGAIAACGLAQGGDAILGAARELGAIDPVRRVRALHRRVVIGRGRSRRLANLRRARVGVGEDRRREQGEGEQRTADEAHGRAPSRRSYSARRTVTSRPAV